MGPLYPPACAIALLASCTVVVAEASASSLSPAPNADCGCDFLRAQQRRVLPKSSGSSGAQPISRRTASTALPREFLSQCGSCSQELHARSGGRSPSDSFSARCKRLQVYSALTWKSARQLPFRGFPGARARNSACPSAINRRSAPIGLCRSFRSGISTLPHRLDRRRFAASQRSKSAEPASQRFSLVRRLQTPQGRYIL